jgi:hypothetical protein
MPKARRGLMSTSIRCTICDVAWALGKSEMEFFHDYDQYERAQLIATYQSKAERSTVASLFPPKVKKGGR